MKIFRAHCDWGSNKQTEVVPPKSEKNSGKFAALDMATFFGRDTGLKHPIWLLNSSERVIYYGASREIALTFSADGHIEAPDFPDKDKVKEWVALNITPLNKLYNDDDKDNRYTIEDFDREMLSL